MAIAEWSMLFNRVTAEYTEEQRDALAKGLCPNCHPTPMPYRIMETFYSEQFQTRVHRVKCFNLAGCDWDGYIPATRPETGWDDFFHS
ncbi:hypothetical protein [Alicyclobacillus dauci]|uniref:Uncharacterized protein n=1 Tax=Alicyclobacillus dauci TaxID=1475485 RepID=A0ABY6Z9Z9_9BACL|nr:hypothetical protein [Alicyclobacillus dauci]WAH39352.1 hypothetical protein NZD86_23585 [Alicyclobacillus dauci]